MGSGFGELRSLMNREHLCAQTRAQLWALMRTKYAESPQEYEAQWLAYLSGFPAHFEQIWYAMEELEELEHAARLIPHACLFFRLYNKLAPGQLEAITCSPALWGVRAMRLNRNALNASKLCTLLGSPHLTHLKALYTSSNALTGELGQLFEVASFTALEALHIWEGALGDLGAQELAQAAMPHLRELNLNANAITSPGLQALARWPSLAQVRSLELAWNPCELEGMQALFASPYLEQLTHLDISGTDEHGGVIKALTCSPHLRALTSLKMSYNTMTQADSEALAGWEHAAQLERLDISACRLSDVERAILAKSPYLSEATLEQVWR